MKKRLKKLCGQLPEYRIVDESEVLLSIPVASQENSAGRVVISVYKNNYTPLSSVQLLLLFPNHTWIQATTDDSGSATVELHSTHLPMTVFAAKKGYTAFVQHEWVPSESLLTIVMQDFLNVGSIIITNRSGNLPSLNGKLNPFIDDLGKAFLIATNIEVNQGVEQPVRIAFGREVHLRDSNGYQLWCKFISIIGSSSLVEYRRL